MQAVEGYFENGHFYPVGQLTAIHGRRRAIVTILDEPARDEDVSKGIHAGAWHEFLGDIKKIKAEPLPEFERVQFRESDT